MPIPMQVQVLEADYIDTTRTGIRLANGGRIIQGKEFDAIGRCVAYWLYPEHPGSSEFFSEASRRVSAENILHVYRQTRPGQVRGVSWFAPVILALKDFDEYADAQLAKQKIAACLAVVVTDPQGAAQALGEATEGETSADGTGAQGPQWDHIGPGAVLTTPPGRDIEVVRPPSVGDYGSYSEVTLRQIATGIGVTYEDLTGDYTDMPFSAARMSRLRHWARVEDWRWQTLIPQFCDPVWNWFTEVGGIFGRAAMGTRAEWTAPPPPMVDPDKEGLAYIRKVRGGFQSLSDVLREMGYNPKVVLNELANDFKLLDKLGLVLDSDPRKMTASGQFQSAPASPAPPEDDEGDEPDPDDDDGMDREIGAMRRRLAVATAELLAANAAKKRPARMNGRAKA